ncbi:hypothetical protein EB796_017132 [Bugula neritina]|uniref:Uncharacterized protein n=1 Tax=Bugula neritina TaxID=10212 RepID=A0A7J7JE39_BUGNE|nr:hypothetical protein EB796_017132 [Bugula neritina]
MPPSALLGNDPTPEQKQTKWRLTKTSDTKPQSLHRKSGKSKPKSTTEPSNLTKHNTSTESLKERTKYPQKKLSREKKIQSESCGSRLANHSSSSSSSSITIDGRAAGFTSLHGDQNNNRRKKE